MNVNRCLVLLTGGLIFVLVDLLFGLPTKHAVGQDLMSSLTLEDHDSPLTTPRQVTSSVNRIRASYQNLVDQIEGALRNVQGVEELGQYTDIEGGSFPIRQRTDIAVTGARTWSCWSGLNPGPEFRLPSRVSRTEEALIRAAGEIRAANCSNLLLNRITDVGNVGVLSSEAMRRPDRQRSPAFDALYHIGEPACHEALKRIPLESDELRRIFMVGLMQSCLGDAKVKSWLVKLQESLTEEIHRDRVDSAIAQINAGPCPDSLREFHKSKSRIAQ